MWLGVGDPTRGFANDTAMNDWVAVEEVSFNSIQGLVITTYKQQWWKSKVVFLKGGNLIQVL